ncbi:DUF1707 SHOCT-like domain-containing protein [Geodermatophilus sp. URMC 64]
MTDATATGEQTGHLPPGPRIRASDADRTATVAVLHDAVSRGLLTAEEGGDRMAAALEARFLDELPALTSDLPPAAAPTAPGWRAVGSMLATQVRTELQGGLRSRRVAVAALAAVLLLVLLVTLGGLAVHGLVDGGVDPRAGFRGR